MQVIAKYRVSDLPPNAQLALSISGARETDTLVVYEDKTVRLIRPVSLVIGEVVLRELTPDADRPRYVGLRSPPLPEAREIPPEERAQLEQLHPSSLPQGHRLRAL